MEKVMQADEKVLNGPDLLDPEKNEKLEYVDFKMVTFSLGGKDYGIDIMNVKEISRVNDFTYVPNTAEFVRGVYNLRGDIISVMDLRKLFGVDPVIAKDGLEDLIVLKGEEYMTGAVVDTIDRVVGVNSSRIQPPHPLFAEINIYFIKGVVEFEGRLYIILDVEKILSTGKTIPEDVGEEVGNVIRSLPQISSNFSTAPANNFQNKPVKNVNQTMSTAIPVAKSSPSPIKANVAAVKTPSITGNRVAAVTASKPSSSSASSSRTNTNKKTDSNKTTDKLYKNNSTTANKPSGVRGNILGDVIKKQQSQTDDLVSQMLEKKVAKTKSVASGGSKLDQTKKELENQLEFYVNKVNLKWIENKLSSTGSSPSGYADSEKFIADFLSRSTSELWSEVMLDELIDLLPDDKSSTLYTWNPGCGVGYESYSIAVALSERYDNLITKLWANDTDLVNVSMAPTLALDETEFPVRFSPYLEEGRGGKKFVKQITNNILFEYHDLTHENPYPEMSLIIARDLLSYIEADKVDYVLNEMVSKLKSGGLFIAGENEIFSHPDLIKKESKLFNLFVKR